MSNLEKRFYTIDEVKAIIGMGRTFIYKMIGKGVLIAREMGGRTRITSESLEALIANGYKRRRK